MQEPNLNQFHNNKTKTYHLKGWESELNRISFYTNTLLSPEKKKRSTSSGEKANNAKGNILIDEHACGWVSNLLFIGVGAWWTC